MLNDFRYAVRSLRRSPGFAATAVAALALGIGANVAVFSVVNSVLLRPLPYRDADRLVALRTDLPRQPLEDIGSSAAEFADHRERNRALEPVGAYGYATVSLTGEYAGGRPAAAWEPERLTAAPVSAGLWPALGVAPALGRVFGIEEDRAGAARVVVLGHALWRRRFGADAGVVGRQIVLDGEPYTVTGVMPPSFRFPSWAELWVPLALTPRQLSEEERGSHYLGVVGRLAPGVTLRGAQAATNAVAAQLEREHASTYEAGYRALLVPLRERLVGKVARPLLVLFGAVSVVLLIACSNVAALLLARAAARQREVAIRVALGATRLRLASQLLTESLVLAAIGGAVGVLLAMWGVRGLLALRPAYLPRIDEIGVDLRALAFALGVSLVTGALFGLAPVGAVVRGDASGALAGRLRGAPRRQRLRGALVVSEVALALVLLVGAGLLIRSFALLRGVDPGFRPDRVLSLRVALPEGRYEKREQIAAFYEALLERISALPGVRSAGATTILPISGEAWDVSFAIDGAAAGGASPNAQYRPVTPGYFATMGIPLVTGRALSERDTWDAPNVAVVNQALVRAYFRDAGPLGRRARLPWLGARDTSHVREIVGVVADVRHFGLDADPKPEMYVPFAQQPRRGQTLVVRVAGDPAAFAPAARRAVRALDAELPVYDVRPMAAVIGESVSERRFNAVLLGALAVAALALTLVGVYGVVAHGVAQRTREFGVRIALGAQPSDVLRLVVGRGLALALAGVALGTVGALAVTRVLSGLLYGVGATDPLTFAGVAALLAGTAAAASYLPARRATKADPLQALRAE